MHLDGQLKLRLGQASNAGVKPENEDSIGIRLPAGHQLTTKGACAVIADGVSAAEAGREASHTCVTSFLADYYSTPETWSVKKSAYQVLTALNRWLFGQGQRFIRAEKGYVSTLSIAVFKSRTAHLFHVGDSRIYRWRSGDLEQLTRDHATRIDRQQSYLTRAMGLDQRLDIDYRSVDLAAGDIYLLTTDGVHDFLTDRELAQALAALSQSDAADFEPNCNALIAAALENQSHDNLSCQIVRIDALPSEDSNDVWQKLVQLPFPPLLNPGMVLDGLRIDAEIHASTRSQLYRVTDTASGAVYAMKTPSSNFSDAPAYIERFIMESWIGSRIDSPHVVKVAQREQPRSCLYYLTEFIEGESITAYGKRLPPNDIAARIALLQQLGLGLRALHRRETLHQDIKPDNVLVDSAGRVHLIDFGSCLVAGIAEISAPITRDHVLGTASYSAPEHVLGHKAGARADLFSMAVVAFEVLAGQPPFEGALEHCRTPEHYHRLRYVPCHQYNPHVPVWMDGALRKAMNIDADARYQEVAEFLYDLQNPNQAFTEREALPLLARNPLRVWQALSGLLLLSNLLLLWLLNVR